MAEANGLRKNAIFNPIDTSWTEKSSMTSPRWYPTNTTLPDGTVLTTGGSQFVQMVVHGGSPAADSATIWGPKLPRDTLSLTAAWDTPARSIPWRPGCS